MIEAGPPVKDISIGKDSTTSSIFREMAESGGFEAVNLSAGLDILSEMIADAKCLKFLSFVAAITSTGLRGIIKDMIKRRWFDVVITTCGALDHDIARSYGSYKSGSFTMDDSKLADQNMHRLGNVIVPMESYGPAIESKMQEFLQKEYDAGVREMSSADITRMIGANLSEESFLHHAYKNNIPVIVPGIVDGAVGSQIWLFVQKHSNFALNLIKDADILSSMIFKAKRSGSLMIGGGISKHHSLWWNQYRGGLDYAVYITTAQEFDGSLSGALVREAVSWGKVTQNAKQITLHAEATTILPFLYAALLSRL